MTILAQGDRVKITCAGRTVDGKVTLASENGRSLMLTFEAILHGHAGTMPVLQGDDGIYRSLIGKHVVEIEKIPLLH